MVDLKKINLPKVNVDPRKMMGAVDGLVEKIPPQIANLLRKIAMGLLIFFIIMCIYFGFSKGWESATPQGLQLAQDARSLFSVEIEKEYNRSRKDVRMSNPEDVSYETNRKMMFDFVSEREQGNPDRKPAPEESDFLGKEHDFRNRKNQNTETPPLATPSGDGLISSPINVESIGAWQNNDELKQLESIKEIQRRNLDLSRKAVKSIPSAMKPSDSETEEDKRFQKTLDRLDQLEKRVSEKKMKEASPSNASPTSESTSVEKKKPRELDRLPR